MKNTEKLEKLENMKLMENSKNVMGFAGHLYDEQLYVIKLDL